MSIVEHSPLTRSRLHRNARGPESQHKLIAETTHMAVGCHNPTSAFSLNLPVPRTDSISRGPSRQCSRGNAASGDHGYMPNHGRVTGVAHVQTLLPMSKLYYP